MAPWGEGPIAAHSWTGEPYPQLLFRSGTRTISSRNVLLSVYPTTRSDLTSGAYFFCSSINSLSCFFRGNHETPGKWHFGQFENDVDDLEVVVAYLAKEFGYIVDMLVGHSRGSVVSMLWLCKHRDGLAKNVRRYVNVSGRYRMEVCSLLPSEALAAECCTTAGLVRKHMVSGLCGQIRQPEFTQWRHRRD